MGVEETMHNKEYLSVGVLIAAVLFFGLFFFTQAGITGHITKDLPKGNMVLGFYSFTPNFKVQTSLDFSVYDNIAKDLQILIGCAASGTPMDSCIAIRQFTKELTWEIDCDKGSRRLVADVAKLYEDCLSQPDTNCVCTFDFGDSSYTSKNSLEGTYTLKASLSDGSILITDEQSGIALNAPVSNEQSVAVLPLLAFDFSSATPLSLAIPKENEEPKDFSRPMKEMAVYKRTIAGKVQIDVLKQESGRYTTLSGEPLQTSNGDPISKENIKMCPKAPQSIQRFCVFDPKKTVFVVDEEGNVGNKPVVIRFAAHMPDTPPPPLTGFDVKSMPKSSGTLVVLWKKSIANDVANYAIYSTTQDSGLQSSVQQLRQSSQVSIRSFPITSATALSALPSFETCTMEIGKGCAFVIGDKVHILQKNTLYTAPDSGKNDHYFVLLDGLADGVSYSVGATAIDVGGNEIDNDKQLMPVKSKQPQDELPPLSSDIVSRPTSFDSLFDKDAKTLTLPLKVPPTKNIDNTELQDFGNGAYAVYAAQSPPTSAASLSTFMEIPNTIVMQNGQKALAIDFSGISMGTYSLVVVAQDSKQNPKKDLFTIAELGADIQVPISIP